MSNHSYGNGPEVRLHDDGTLDEVCTPTFHLEQMDSNHWFLEVEIGGKSVAVWLYAKGKITATYERRENAAPPPSRGLKPGEVSDSSLKPAAAAPLGPDSEGWIPVSEQIPGDSDAGPWLIANRFHVGVTHVMPCWWNLKASVNGENHDGPPVTHWMPLPASPFATNSTGGTDGRA